MFYFIFNESKIYEIVTFWNKLQEKLFHVNFLDVPVYIYIYKESLVMCQASTSGNILLLVSL